MTALYSFGWHVSRLGFRLFTRLTVEGVENLPAEGGFLLLPNHQSAMDPFLVQGFCPRPIHSMTKSTQFASPVHRWVMPRILGFPVRRYRIDPQAVRMVLRLLAEGRAVCIYPEGERTWDGSLQQFRHGTLRVMLHAGVPVVPCGVEGTWDFWPRWRRGPRLRTPIAVRFGEPLRFGPFATRRERDAAIPEAERILRERLLELSGESRWRPGGADEGPTTEPGISRASPRVTDATPD